MRRRRGFVKVVLGGVVCLFVLRYFTYLSTIQVSQCPNCDIEVADAAIRQHVDVGQALTPPYPDYLGCWTETTKPQQQATFIVKERTLHKCLGICRSQGAPFLSVTAKDRCRCEHELTRFKPADKGACHQVCQYDLTAMCGGWRATSIYLIANQTTPVKDPTKLHILAYHRSGSTFVGEIFRQHPESFYIFEPFWPLGVDHIVGSKETTRQAAVLIKDFLNCNIQRISPVFLFRLHRLLKHTTIYSQNDPLVKYIQCTETFAGHEDKLDQSACIKLLEYYCQRSSMRVVKAVRIQLKISSILLDLDPSIKLIHLVRDPRPVLLSQQHIGLIHNYTDGIRYCKELPMNMEFSKNINPHKLYFLRYEDLTERPVDVVKSLFTFIGRSDAHKIIPWLKSVTKGPEKQSIAIIGAIKVNSKYKSNEWKLRFKSKPNDLRGIQDMCLEGMELCGYLNINSKQLDDINIQTMKEPPIYFKHASVHIVKH